MAILHSLWQSALLMLLYLAANRLFLHKANPLAKRNFLFIVLFSQVLLFSLTLYIVHSGSSLYDVNGIGHLLSGLSGNETMQTAAPWLFLVYSLIIGYKLVRSVYAWVSFKQQFRLGLQRPDVELKLFTELKTYQFGIHRKVKLWLSNRIHTPVTFGFFKPVIVLPVALVNNISTRQAETLILHELTHIRTNDYLLNWFLLFTETVFFFNPFVRNFSEKIRMEREKNCDMGVMAFEYSPVLYAETLLQAERMKQLVPGFQLAAVSRKQQLLDRIRFFSGNLDFQNRIRFNIVVPVIGLFLLIFFSSIALFQPGNAIAPALLDPASATYLPANNIEIPVVYATETPVETAQTQQKLKEAENQMALASAQLKLKEETELLSKQIEKEAEAMAKLADQRFAAMPVAVTENDGSKQIIIQEESSGTSKTATLKSYALRFENGQWILEPVWTISAKEIPTDSLLKRADSSQEKVRKIYPAQQ